jgi:hypothetical protein
MEFDLNGERPNGSVDGSVFRPLATGHAMHGFVPGFQSAGMTLQAHEHQQFLGGDSGMRTVGGFGGRSAGSSGDGGERDASSYPAMHQRGRAHGGVNFGPSVVVSPESVNLYKNLGGHLSTAPPQPLPRLHQDAEVELKHRMALTAKQAEEAQAKQDELGDQDGVAQADTTDTFADVRSRFLVSCSCWSSLLYGLNEYGTACHISTSPSVCGAQTLLVAGLDWLKQFPLTNQFVLRQHLSLDLIFPPLDPVLTLPLQYAPKNEGIALLGQPHPDPVVETSAMASASALLSKGWHVCFSHHISQFSGHTCLHIPSVGLPLHAGGLTLVSFSPPTLLPFIVLTHSFNRAGSSTKHRSLAVQAQSSQRDHHRWAPLCFAARDDHLRIASSLSVS